MISAPQCGFQPKPATRYHPDLLLFLDIFYLESDQLFAFACLTSDGKNYMFYRSSLPVFKTERKVMKSHKNAFLFLASQDAIEVMCVTY